MGSGHPLSIAHTGAASENALFSDARIALDVWSIGTLLPERGLMAVLLENAAPAPLVSAVPRLWTPYGPLLPGDRPRRLGKTAPRFPPDRNPAVAPLRRLPGRPDVPHWPDELIAALETCNRRTLSARAPAPEPAGEDLERTRRDWRARQVKLPVATDPAPLLPCPGMRIVRAGVLEVEFASERICWDGCMSW